MIRHTPRPRASRPSASRSKGGHRRTSQISRSLFASALLLIAFACNPGTGGRTVAIHFELGGTDEPSFVSALGWQVELTRASISLGPFYAVAPADALFARLAAPLAPSRAFAHAGTNPLDGRSVRAELLERIELDALDPNPWQRDIFAEEGTVDELSVALVPTDAGATAFVEGVAMRDDAVIPFSGTLTLQDDESSQIDGIALTGTLAEGSTIAVTVDPRPWLDGVAFDRLEGPTLQAQSHARDAWRIGVRATRSFQTRVLTPEVP